MKNLRIIGTSVGAYKAGDIVPAYALASADPAFLTEVRIVEPTDEPATVEVTADELAQAAPDASADLVKAHAKLLAQTATDAGSIASLHAKCVELESKSEALSKELSAKTVELAEAKKARDQYAVDLESAKSVIDKLKNETADLNTLLQEADKK